MYKLWIILLLGVLCNLTNGHHSPDHKEEESSDSPATVQHIEVGEHCTPAAAPGPDGTSWHTVEHNVEKICAEGSSCRGGACNCDDLPDGTQMGISQDNDGTRVCRRLGNQKCSKDEECFKSVPCIDGVCTCPQDVPCQTTKNDVYILD